MKKYKLTQETSEDGFGVKLYRIQALKNFGNVKAGDLGGFVKSEYNLSQEGDCWIYDYAKVSDNAKISDNAKVLNYARIYDCSIIRGNAIVRDNAVISGFTTIEGNAVICDEAYVYGNSSIKDNALVCEYVELYSCNVCDNATVFGNEKANYWTINNNDNICDLDKLDDFFDEDDSSKVDFKTQKLFGVLDSQVINFNGIDGYDFLLFFSFMSEYGNDNEDDYNKQCEQLQKIIESRYNESADADAAVDVLLLEMDNYFKENMMKVRDENMKKYCNDLRKPYF